MKNIIKERRRKALFLSMFQQKTFLVLMFWILVFVRIVQNADKFCSAYCKPKSCSTTLYTGCTDCSFPFMLTGGLCQIDPNSGFQVIGESQNGIYAAGITMTNNDTSLTTQTCTGGAVFSGKLTDQQFITITASPGTTLPHFNIRLVFFGIMTDNWSSNARFTIKLLSTGQIQTRKRDNQDQQARLCATSNQDDDKFRVDQTFAHSQIDDTIPIEFEIHITKDSLGNMFTAGSANGDWGIKQFILLAQLCHPACTACWDNLINTCTACNQSLPYYLSGTTCNQTCLTGYGYTDYSNVCVFCDKRCQVCFNMSDNCTVCTSSGTWQSYLVEVNFSCVAVCPAGYYGNTTIHVCQPCNIQCSTCKYNSSYCLSCNVTNGYGWNTYSCYNPCPLGTFSNLGGANCSNCNSKCITCENTSTLCFDCTLSGVNQAYYFNQTTPPSTAYPTTTCLTNCPNQYYKQNYNSSGPNVCLPCNDSCFQCFSSPINCTYCNPTYFLFQSSCISDCPDDYFGDQLTRACMLCQTNCTILTINFSHPYQNKKQLWIDMNFSQQIDFTKIIRQTFQTLRMNQFPIEKQLFTTTFQLTGNSSYRILLRHIGNILFQEKNVTVKTISQPSPPYQSVTGRPFRPDNYLKKESFNWSQISTSNSTSDKQTKTQAALILSIVCSLILFSIIIGILIFYIKKRIFSNYLNLQTNRTQIEENNKMRRQPSLDQLQQNGINLR